MILDNVIGPVRPITWVFRFWPVLMTSFVCALAATWLCKKVALRFGIVDNPDATVKTHKEPVAYLGGVAIFIGFAAGILAAFALFIQAQFYSEIITKLLGVVAGAGIACGVGLVDDLLNIRPQQKILGQVVAAVALLAVGIVPNLSSTAELFDITIPGGIELMLEILIVVFFVIGASNSLNLLDGLDGLCAGVTAIITFAMLLLAAHLATWGSSEVYDPLRIIICMALAGGVCGFLPFNRHPAKIFMGDAGSMLLGFTVAALMMLFAERIPRWWMASIVIFGLPILDTGVAIARRLLNLRPILVSDRGHIYDQMIDRGIPLKKTVLICYLLAGLYAIIGLAMSQIRTRYAVFVYIAVFAISGVVVWKKGYLKMKGIRGVVKAEE